MSQEARALLVVADTTPVLYLARIDQLDLLARLYERIVVPGQCGESWSRRGRTRLAWR